MVFPFRFGPGACCCESAVCWTWTDNFNRADSTNLGADWNEVSGNWAISTNRLVEPATTTKKVIGTNPVPTRSAGEMYVAVSLINPAVNDVYIIHLAVDDTNGTDGEWVQFTYSATNTWVVLLSTGETKTQTWSPLTPGVFPVVACIDSDGFLMGAVASSGDEYPWSDNAGFQDGRYYGLGHGATTAGVAFDDFAVYELRTPDQECRNCFCHCAGNNLRKTLTGTIFDATGRASCMNGLQVTFTWEWNGGTTRWVSNVLTVTGGAQFKWYFICGSYNPADPFAHFTLHWYPGYKLCCSGNPGGCDAAHVADPDASRCNSLSLVFGVFVLSIGELTCTACNTSTDNTGSYSMAITE